MSCISVHLTYSYADTLMCAFFVCIIIITVYIVILPLLLPQALITLPV